MLRSMEMGHQVESWSCGLYSPYRGGKGWNMDELCFYLHAGPQLCSCAVDWASMLLNLKG